MAKSLAEIKKIKQKQELFFSVDGRMMGEIGQKLVTHNYLALVELIKNAYDADSRSVNVKFKSILTDLKQQKASIIITDEGQGMTFKEIQDYWMKLSTPHKENKPFSKLYGRPRTGSKGIGRFACQRLSKNLFIRSISEPDNNGDSEITFVFFKWSDFKSGTDLTKIPCKYKKYKKKGIKSGFRLKLIGLNEQWKQGDINFLQRKLVSLSIAKPKRRYDYSEDFGFSINLDSPETIKEYKSLGEKVLHAGWCSLSGKVGNNGNVSCDLNAHYIGKKTYKLSEKYPMLNGCKFNIHFIPSSKKHFRKPSLLNASEFRQMQESESGIKIYSEDFRVYPYGDAGNDWLKLDADVARRLARVKDEPLKEIALSLNLTPGLVLLHLPRNANIFGSIEINANNNSPFKIKVDREGLVENEAAKTLTIVIRKLIDWITVNYAYYLSLKKEKALDLAREEFNNLKKDDSDNDEDTNTTSIKPNENIKNALDFIDSTIKISKLDTKNLKIFNSAKSLIEKEFDYKDNELDMLRYVASSGPLLFVFVHEFRNLISELDTNAGLLENLSIGKSIDEKKLILEMASKLRGTRKRIFAVEELITIFSSSIKTNKKVFLLNKTIDKISNGFEYITKENDINITPEIPNKLLKTKKIAESAIYSILVNVISNAVKAVLAIKGKREISVSAYRDTKGLIIEVMDTGIGLKKENWEDVFKPMISDPSGNLYNNLGSILSGGSMDTLGRGTGLGLSIVKSLVINNGGKVRFKNPIKNWSTCIEIQLP